MLHVKRKLSCIINFCHFHKKILWISNNLSIEMTKKICYTVSAKEVRANGQVKIKSLKKQILSKTDHRSADIKNKVR